MKSSPLICALTGSPQTLPEGVTPVTEKAEKLRQTPTGWLVFQVGSQKEMKTFGHFFFFLFLRRRRECPCRQVRGNPWVNASLFLYFSPTSFPKAFLCFHVTFPAAGTAASVHRARQGAGSGGTTVGWEN